MSREQHCAQTYQAGLAAERSVARQYLRQGYEFRDHRWRGKGGEIDIVFADGDTVVFVEVKKSATFDRAVQSLSRRQIGRILQTGAEYIGHLPRGSLTPVRFDVALVDARGAVQVLENALAA
ncbi:YraN family protein [Mesobacterium sp. TK19101]|uniref:UPF0102 protein VK792_15080 n=1 Tax=Mesobacterium hydrothermale TaxID=3111907 RepID=A0ABU6HMD6_9RHOB|nr:YraN family protein [Mesobacterium sp. TK19101]MEC3862613.1 YraN family protein [Mesobacterium sp. TK19101]